MTYHTNHCWCSESSYGGAFDAEVMVYFDKFISNDFIDENDLSIKDLDFDNLIESKSFFNEDKFKSSLDFMKKVYDKANIEVTQKMIDDNRTSSFCEVYTLKQNVINWLDKNIKDIIGTDSNTPLSQRKAWCIGSDNYN